jgi:hypothetical protein
MMSFVIEGPQEEFLAIDLMGAVIGSVEVDGGGAL